MITTSKKSTSLADLPNIIIFMPVEMRGDIITNPALSLPNIRRLQNSGAITFTQNYSVNPVCGPSRCCNFTGQYIHSNAHRSLYQLLEPHETNLFQLLKKRGYNVTWIGRNDLFSKAAIKSSISTHEGIIPLVAKKMLKAVPARTKLALIKEGLKFLKNRKKKTGDPLAPIFKLLEPYLKQNPYPLNDKYRNSFYFGERTALQAELDIDSAIIEKAISFISKQASSPKKRPFCLFIALNYPHPPYTVEEPYFSQFKRSELHDLIPPMHEDKPKYYKIMQERYGLQNLNADDFKEIRATYYGMNAKLDMQLGQILDALEKNGQSSESAFFFLSDHGDYAGDYGLTEKWPTGMEDCLLNVPFIVKIPQIATGNREIESLTQSIDLFPTILELADVDTKYTHFGKSLLPLITNPEIVHRDAVFAEGGYDTREPQCFEQKISDQTNNMTGIYYHKVQIAQDLPESVCRTVMMRTKTRKIILRSVQGEVEEFYNLELDPQEKTNLFTDSNYQIEIQAMKEQILKWYLATSDNPHWESKREI